VKNPNSTLPARHNIVSRGDVVKCVRRCLRETIERRIDIAQPRLSLQPADTTCWFSSATIPAKDGAASEVPV
jgi:hypothetical protein